MGDLFAFQSIDIPVPVAGAPLGGGAGLRELDFHVDAQQQNHWCWAAVSTGVANFYAKAQVTTQCEVAATTLQDPACCPAPRRNNPGDKDWYLDKALETVGHMSPSGYEAVLSYDELAVEIGLERPIGIFILWSSNAGHFVGVRGVDDDSEILITDSIHGPVHLTWELLTQGGYKQDGTYQYSYRTVP